MSFLQSVIEDLNAGRVERAFPHKPVGWLSSLGEESLYSADYDRCYSFGERNWHISICYDSFLMCIRKTTLFNGKYELPLTKAERKELYAAYSACMEAEQERYLERLYAAQQ